MRSFLVASRTASVVMYLLGCGGSTTAPADAAHAGDASGHGDAAHVDAGPFDAGPREPCPLTFAGCTAIDDHTGEARVTIAFGDFAYTPRCIRISPGTVVTIPASGLHPLRGATCSPSSSPLPRTPTSAGDDYTFLASGNYGYFCNAHGSNAGSGMSGLIVVE